MLQIETFHLGTESHPSEPTASKAEVHLSVTPHAGVTAHAVISPIDVGRHPDARSARRALASHLMRLAEIVDVVDTSDLDAMPEGARPDDAPSYGPPLGAPDWMYEGRTAHDPGDEDVSKPATAPDRPVLEGSGVHL